MESYSIAEARDRFSSLVEAAENGERIEITRYGRPVAVISSPAQSAGPQRKITAADLAELRQFRESLGASLPPGETWAQIIREIRDEEG